MTLYIIETGDPRLISYLKKNYNVVKIMVIVDVKDHRPLNALGRKDNNIRIKRVPDLILFTIPQ